MDRDELDSPAAPGASGAAAQVLPARAGWPVSARAAREAACELGDGLSLRAVVMLALVALVLALAPVAAVELPPLTDYPFHIARISILDHWSAWPSLHRFYALGSFLLPNLAMDLALLGLGQILPIEIAGRLFIALTLALMLSGTLALHWSLHRRFAVWPVVAALFLHNWIFVFGFLNYLFGVGLMLWALAIWIAAASRPASQRLAIGAALALALYFAHMVALGVYAVAVAGLELQRAWPRLRARPHEAIGRLTIGALPFVPPLLLFVLVSPTGHAGTGFKYAPEWYWKGFVVARTFMSMNLGLDFLTALALLLVAIAVLARGRIVFAREMLLGLALLLAIYLAIPWKMFTATFVDARIPAALIFFVIASTQVTFTRVRAGRAVYLLLGALLIARSVVLTGDWIRFDKTLGTINQTLAQLPDDSVIVTATAAPLPTSLPEWVDRWRPPVQHAAALTLLHKPAFSVSLWATPAQQPIVVTGPWEPLYRYHEQNPIEIANTAQLQAAVDKTLALVARAAGSDLPVFLLLVHPSYVHYPLPSNLTRVAAGPRFILFRIERG